MQRVKFGKAVIDVPIKSIPILLIQEVLNPFYVFQVFSVVLWYVERYNLYATCILIISILSAGTSLYETLTNLKRVK